MYLREESLITKAKSSKKLPNFVWGTVLGLLIMFIRQMMGGICLAPVYFFLNTHYHIYIYLNFQYLP